MPPSEAFSYDLRVEPWIPCERPDGSRALLGIRDALLQAHSLSAVHDESPLVTATLHRLLLAILQRVFAPKNIGEWVKLWDQPSFAVEALDTYLERWKDRFDLFHARRPFMQVANLRDVLRTEEGKDPATEAWRLPLESSQHSGATSLFEALPSNPFLYPAEAARALLAFHGFVPGGRIQNEAESWKSGNLRSGAVVLVRGASLNRTLLLNLIWSKERARDDVPPWERERDIERMIRAPFGATDTLLWPSRRVQLLPSAGADGVVVRNVLTAAGERFEEEQPEGMFAYTVRDPKKPAFAIRVDVERSVWRDATALFEVAHDKDGVRRPAACEQVYELVQEGHLPRSARFELLVLGLASDQQKINVWRTETVPLPTTVLSDGKRMKTLRSALERAESLARELDTKVLRTLAENALAPGERDAHAQDIAQLKRSLAAMPRYWSTLGSAFLPWLDQLGRDCQLEALLDDWIETLRNTAHEVLKYAARRLGAGSRALQAGAKAQRSLNAVLWRLRDEWAGQGGPTRSGATPSGDAS